MMAQLWRGEEITRAVILGDVSEELDEIYADDSIVNVVGNRNAFAAISKGGRVVSWGISAAGLRRFLLL